MLIKVFLAHFMHIYLAHLMQLFKLTSLPRPWQFWTTLCVAIVSIGLVWKTHVSAEQRPSRDADGVYAIFNINEQTVKFPKRKYHARRHLQPSIRQNICKQFSYTKQWQIHNKHNSLGNILGLYYFMNHWMTAILLLLLSLSLLSLSACVYWTTYLLTYRADHHQTYYEMQVSCTLLRQVCHYTGRHVERRHQFYCSAQSRQQRRCLRQQNSSRHHNSRT